MNQIKDNLIPIKPSHIKFYDDLPLYYISDKGEPVLYKKSDVPVGKKLIDSEKQSQFFILRKDEGLVTQNLISALNRKLAEDISSKGIATIKQLICQIVDEALQGPHEASLSLLPETIEIFFCNAKKSPKFLEALASIESKSSRIIEHSVNVLALTMQYCFFKESTNDEIRKLGLCALLHDVGTCHLDKELIETKELLSEEEFKRMKSHTTKGYNDLKSNKAFDKSVALAALEHHELLDGTGYPNGTREPSFESQVIGLIDSYEPLKYNEKSYRKALKAYDALQVLKKDVLKERYNKQVFVDLCSCLTK